LSQQFWLLVMAMDGQADKVTYTNNEKHSSKDSSRHCPQDLEKWTGHGPNQGQAHEKMRYTLFNHGGGLNYGFADLCALTFLRGYPFQTSLVDGE
jgi:prepilin-type processing-associated H-X9-DG protein